MNDMSTHPGYHDSKDDVLKRLRRIEGQVRGLQRMVEEDTYCIDVLTQVAAATKALQSVPSDSSTSTCGTASPAPSPTAARPRPTAS